MKLSDALNGVTQLGLDSAPLIYFIERHPVYFSSMLDVIQRFDSGSLSGVLSTIALTEVLVQPLKKEETELAGRYETLLLHGKGLSLVPVTASISRKAAQLRAEHNIRTPDALHLATAIESKCEAFLTNDRTLTRVTDLRVMMLDDLE